MIPILSNAVEKYLYDILPKRDPVLAEMERYAKKHDVPIIGPAVARMFYLLARGAFSKWARRSAIQRSGSRAPQGRTPRFTTRTEMRRMPSGRADIFSGPASTNACKFLPAMRSN